MMQIIEHGNTYNTAKCDKCGCVFGYTNTETTTTFKNGGKIRLDSWVSCPECGYSVVIEEYGE